MSPVDLFTQSLLDSIQLLTCLALLVLRNDIRIASDYVSSKLLHLFSIKPQAPTQFKYPQDIHSFDRPLHLKVRLTPSPWSSPSPIMRVQYVPIKRTPLISFAQGSH